MSTLEQIEAWKKMSISDLEKEKERISKSIAKGNSYLVESYKQLDMVLFFKLEDKYITPFFKNEKE